MGAVVKYLARFVCCLIVDVACAQTKAVLVAPTPNVSCPVVCLRMGPPPHLPMMVFPPDKPLNHFREMLSIHIWKGDTDAFPT